jgi:hypothetical protein
MHSYIDENNKQLTLNYFKKGMHIIQLFQKTQPGKKGKKVASGSSGIIRKSSTFYVGPPHLPDAEYVSTIEDAKNLAIKLMIEEFPIQSKEVLDNFLMDLKKYMNK